LKHLIQRISITMLLSIISANTPAEKYNLSVQPVLPAKQIEQNYQPLVRYLSDKTGHEFAITSYRDFLSYWVKMKKSKDIHFVLDAAHFTDFRIQRKGYSPIVKLPNTVSFTVVTNEDNFVFEMEELISKRIATMSSPSLGAVRLNEMFPNPVRLPFYIQVSDSIEAVNKVLDGSVDAAIITSPLVSNFATLNSVISTDPVPHMALSASPEVPEAVRQAVKKALLEAPETADGKRMLSEMNIEEFQDANQEMYAGYADLLDGVFGY
jgi:ABC-type phosphate/phosphonate transport system substrate-binding protein